MRFNTRFFFAVLTIFFTLYADKSGAYGLPLPSPTAKTEATITKPTSIPSNQDDREDHMLALRDFMENVQDLGGSPYRRSLLKRTMPVATPDKIAMPSQLKGSSSGFLFLPVVGAIPSSSPSSNGQEKVGAAPTRQTMFINIEAPAGGQVTQLDIPSFKDGGKKEEPCPDDLLKDAGLNSKQQSNDKQGSKDQGQDQGQDPALLDGPDPGQDPKKGSQGGDTKFGSKNGTDGLGQGGKNVPGGQGVPSDQGGQFGPAADDYQDGPEAGSKKGGQPMDFNQGGQGGPGANQGGQGGQGPMMNNGSQGPPGFKGQQGPPGGSPPPGGANKSSQPGDTNDPSQFGPPDEMKDINASKNGPSPLATDAPLNGIPASATDKTPLQAPAGIDEKNKTKVVFKPLSDPDPSALNPPTDDKAKSASQPPATNFDSSNPGAAFNNANNSKPNVSTAGGIDGAANSQSPNGFNGSSPDSLAALSSAPGVAGNIPTNPDGALSPPTSTPLSTPPSSGPSNSALPGSIPPPKVAGNPAGGGSNKDYFIYPVEQNDKLVDLKKGDMVAYVDKNGKVDGGGNDQAMAQMLGGGGGSAPSSLPPTGQPPSMPPTSTSPSPDNTATPPPPPPVKRTHPRMWNLIRRREPENKRQLRRKDASQKPTFKFRPGKRDVRKITYYGQPVKE